MERTVPVAGSLCQPDAILTQANRNRCQAGRYRVTPRRNFPLTYEQAQKPHLIGVRKGWNSWNTTTLVGGQMTSEVVVDDIFIRSFITGTWHKCFLSEIIIKRRANAIYISGVVHQIISPRKYYFLIGYTEEMLSLLLKCPVKMDITTVPERNSLVYKYI